MIEKVQVILAVLLCSLSLRARAGSVKAAGEDVEAEEVEVAGQLVPDPSVASCHLVGWGIFEGAIWLKL